MSAARCPVNFKCFASLAHGEKDQIDNKFLIGFDFTVVYCVSTTAYS